MFQSRTYLTVLPVKHRIVHPSSKHLSGALDVALDGSQGLIDITHKCHDLHDVVINAMTVPVESLYIKSRIESYIASIASSSAYAQHAHVLVCYAEHDLCSTDAVAFGY